MSRSLPQTRKGWFCLVLIAAVAAAFALPAVADHDADHHHDGYAADWVKDFDGASKKLTDLAGAIPADKYGWRPVDGVRTVSEVIVHVALANYHLAHALGVAVPESAGPDLEKTLTEKDAVLAELAKSQDAVRSAVKMAAGEPDKMYEVFGSQRSGRGILMIISGHSHEHLGQMIAYARSMGVVPPWSRGE
jgi:uncharacterized damage-inducible protein DinB